MVFLECVHVAGDARSIAYRASTGAPRWWRWRRPRPQRTRRASSQTPWRCGRAAADGSAARRGGGGGDGDGWTQSGAPIVPGAVDYVAWTERVAGFAARPNMQGTPGASGSPGACRLKPSASSPRSAGRCTSTCCLPGNASTGTPNIVGVCTLKAMAIMRARERMLTGEEPTEEEP